MDNDYQQHLKKYQAQVHNLQYIIEKMPGYVYWKNKRSEYMGCNENLAKFSKLKSPQDIIGKTDHDFAWGRKQADQFVKDDQYIMSTGKHLATEYQLPQKRDDGKYLYVRTEKMPLYDPQGEIIGILATAYDITDQKALEKKLVAEKEKAQQANIVKTDFVRNMEHDIRTPFCGIWGLASHLHEQENNPEKKKYLSNIVQSAKELLDYCNRILDFSKIESGMHTLLDKKFELRKIIDSLEAIEKPAAIQKHLNFTIHYDANIPKVLVGDHYRVFRIMMNLLSNAIKFTQHGAVSIDILLIQKTAQQVIVRFSVQDTGLGIPPNKQEFIFEKFSRLTLSNKGIHKGIGLGLRIVKEFMHDLGGEIDLISKINKGTQFICTIPFKLPLTNDYVHDELDSK